jgi:hypothetical protein
VTSTPYITAIYIIILKIKQYSKKEINVNIKKAKTIFVNVFLRKLMYKFINLEKK